MRIMRVPPVLSSKVCSEPANWTQAQQAAELWHENLVQSHRQGREMCCISQARTAQGRAAGVNGIFQNKKKGLWAGGVPPTEGNTFHHLQVATEGMISETQLWTKAPNMCLDFQVSKPLQIFLLTMEKQYSVNVFKSPLILVPPL